MAPTIVSQSAQTLPQLLALKNFTTLDEQIRQAAYVIGLPNDWYNINGEELRSNVIRHVGRARAEWVFKWILDKLRDEAIEGVQARADLRAWSLLNWMLCIVPTSRSATGLRDAHFLTTIERTLQENFDSSIPEQPETKSPDVQSSRVSESSETVQEDPKPSRKRKRPSPATPSPIKRPSTSKDALFQLFGAVVTVIKTITDKTRAIGNSEDFLPAEHMKMALSTESAQAARVLRFWLMAVERLFNTATSSRTSCLELRAVLDIWELRVIDADDDLGVSAEQFSTECLIPTLVLYNELQNEFYEGINNKEKDPVITQAIQDLEKLIGKHLFAPSKAAFFREVATVRGDGKTERPDATLLARNLEPLRAKLLQAAQIQDASVPLPAYFMSIYHAVPQLLDIAISFSPSQSRRNRIMERPWIQAVFIAFLSCAGISLEPPEFIVPQPAIEVLQKMLKILALHEVSIQSSVLADIFRFHSDVKSPQGDDREIRWPLVAALIKLDPDIFLPKTNLNSQISESRQEDFSTTLFDGISSMSDEKLRPVDVASMSTGSIDIRQMSKTSLEQSVASVVPMRRDVLLNLVIFPIMAAFTRNRNLLGFMRTWHLQLIDNTPISHSDLKHSSPSIWEDRRIGLELATYFEKSLTQGQILRLFEQHANLIEAFTTDPTGREMMRMKEAFASTVVLHALLLSVQSDEIIEALEPQLKVLSKCFVSVVQNEQHRSIADLRSCWIVLCQLVCIAWPLNLHGSLEAQTELLEPLIAQACKDVAPARKHSNGAIIYPSTRAAALHFLLTVCDYLKAVPGWDNLLRECVRKALKSLSTNQWDSVDHVRMLDIFCTDFVHLLEFTEADSRTKVLKKLLTTLSGLETTRHQLIELLSGSIFSVTSHHVREAYLDVLLDALGLLEGNENLATAAKAGLLLVRPEALSRHQREATLDKITGLLDSQPGEANLLLHVMNRLMQLPNATSEISSDGEALFNIAKRLHGAKLESDSTLQLFGELISSTLNHLLPNKSQAQNVRYLEVFQKRMLALINNKEQRTRANFTIIRNVFVNQGEHALLSWDHYWVMLNHGLSDSSIPEVDVLDAFNDARSVRVPSNQVLFTNTQTLLHNWFDQKIGFGKLSNNGCIGESILDVHFWVRLHASLAKYRLYPNAQWFIDLSMRILQEKESDIDDIAYRTILRSVDEALTSLPVPEKLALVRSLMSSEDGSNQSLRSSFLHLAIVTLENKLDSGAERKQQQLLILPGICDLLLKCSSITAFHAQFDCLDAILRAKGCLINQYSIEYIIATLAVVASRNSPDLPPANASAIYERVCKTSNLALLLHRGRLGGRFHLLLPLLQNLLSCLFVPNTGRGNTLPPWLKSPPATELVKLDPSNGSQYTRLLSTLCSPTQSSVTKAQARSDQTKASLNDPVKAAKEYASHYIYPLLGSFCRFLLNGRLDPQVREKLMPGIWDAISVANMDRDALDAMFAGLDRASKDVWRGIWDEWERLHGRAADV